MSPSRPEQKTLSENQRSLDPLGVSSEELAWLPTQIAEIAREEVKLMLREKMIDDNVRTIYFSRTQERIISRIATVFQAMAVGAPIGRIKGTVETREFRRRLKDMKSDLPGALSMLEPSRIEHGGFYSWVEIYPDILKKLADAVHDKTKRAKVQRFAAWQVKSLQKYLALPRKLGSVTQSLMTKIANKNEMEARYASQFKTLVREAQSDASSSPPEPDPDIEKKYKQARQRLSFAAWRKWLANNNKKLAPIMSIRHKSFVDWSKTNGRDWEPDVRTIKLSHFRVLWESYERALSRHASEHFPAPK